MRIPLLDEYITLLRQNRDYRLLWLSQVTSLLGDWFNFIASATLVATLTRSGLAIGGLFLARLLPPLVLGPLVGVVADRFNRRKILIVSDLLRAVIVLNFLFVRTEREIWLLYVLTVLQLSISAFFEPTRAAILPGIVSRQNLVTANALDGMTWSTMLALGAALGGLAAFLFGITTSFIVDATTFVLSATLLSRIHLPASDSDRPKNAENNDGWHTFVSGLRYLWEQPPVLMLALVKASFALAYGGMAIIEVTFAKEIFPIGNDGSGTLGLIYCTIGIGTGLAPLMARRVTGDNPILMHWVILLCYIACLIGYLTIGWAYTLPILLIGTFFRTTGSGTSWVYSSSLLQMTVPDHFLGRVFAFDLTMMTLAASLSTLWVGWARDGLGLSPYQTALALAVVPIVMMAVWIVYLSRYLKQQEVLSP